MYFILVNPNRIYICIIHNFHTHTHTVISTLMPSCYIFVIQYTNRSKQFASSICSCIRQSAVNYYYHLWRLLQMKDEQLLRHPFIQCSITVYSVHTHATIWMWKKFFFSLLDIFVAVVILVYSFCMMNKRQRSIHFYVFPIVFRCHGIW